MREPDAEVVWDGRHHGQARDLLVPIHVPAPPPERPLDEPRVRLLRVLLATTLPMAVTAVAREALVEDARAQTEIEALRRQGMVRRRRWGEDRDAVILTTGARQRLRSGRPAARRR